MSPAGDDTNMLNDTRVRNAKHAGRPIKLSDSGGLHLLIQPNGSKLWRLAYRFGGKQKTLAIGVYPTVTLKHAREKRDEAKRLLADNIESLDATPAGKADGGEQQYLSGCRRRGIGEARAGGARCRDACQEALVA
jgi:Arm DNA-binding domain